MTWGTLGSCLPSDSQHTVTGVANHHRGLRGECRCQSGVQSVSIYVDCRRMRTCLRETLKNGCPCGGPAAMLPHLPAAVDRRRRHHPSTRAVLVMQHPPRRLPQVGPAGCRADHAPGATARYELAASCHLHRLAPNTPHGLPPSSWRQQSQKSTPLSRLAPRVERECWRQPALRCRSERG